MSTPYFNPFTKATGSYEAILERYGHVVFCTSTNLKTKWVWPNAEQLRESYMAIMCGLLMIRCCILIAHQCVFMQQKKRR